MRRRRAATGALVGLLMVALAGPARARPVSLAEALELALAHNLELRAVEVKATASRALERSALGALGPRLHVDANVYAWDAPFRIAIGGVPFEVRTDVTSLVTLSGTQPLSGLVTRVDRYRSRRYEHEAAAAEVQAARAEVRLRATAAYLTLLQALDVEGLGGRAVASAEEEVSRARAMVANGRLLDADRLRTEVALARARQELLEARAARQSAAVALAAVIGLPVDTALEPARVDLAHLPPLPSTARTLLERGERQRPQLKAARALADAARANRQAALGELLPAIDLTGGYQHAEGQAFFPRDAGYVAGLLSWDFFSWGERWELSRAERARAEGAVIAVELERRDLAVAVAQRFVEAQAARAAVDVAAAAVGQAEEAYRVTRVLHENGRATTTDLLDARLADERAHLDSARAAYRYLLARAALEQAVGAPLPGS